MITHTLAVLSVVVPAGSASAQIAVLSSTVDERAAVSGARYTGTIVINNPSDQPQTARLYQTDYQFSSDGTSNFGLAGVAPRSNATWVTPQQTRVLIPARGQASVPYSVAVPSNDSLRGSYWSVIMVEAVPTDTASNAGGIGVTSVIRYGLQVATHVGNKGSRAVQLSNATTSVDDHGNALLAVDVEDVGDAAYRPVLWAEIYDDQGVLRGKAKQTRGLLYPGSSLHQRFELGTLPPGSYKAVLFADTGAETIFARQLKVQY